MDRVYYFFLFWYVCGVVLLSFDLIPTWLEWSNVVFLVLAGLLGVFYFTLVFGVQRGILATVIIFIGSFTVEYFGAKDSFLFGSYDYTNRFAPNVFDVPIAIGFAWLMVMGTSHALSKRFSVMVRPFFGGVIGLTIDLIIDPVAFKAKNYWIWTDGGFYYDIPWTNFWGWFVVAFCLHVVLIGIEKSTSVNEVPVWTGRMVVLFVLMISMFTVLAVVHQLWLAIGVTWLLTAVILLLHRAKREFV